MGCIGARGTARSGFRPITSVVTALSAGAVLLVGACTPSPQPTPTGTTGATVSTSPTATTSTTSTTTDGPPSSSVPTTDPGIPPAARENTITGAEAFVRYYVQRINDASRTSNPNLLDPLNGPSCPVCVAIKDSTKARLTAGTHVEGDMWTVQYSITSSFDNQGNATVLLKITQNRVAVVDGSGRVDHYIVANEGRYLATLSYASTWLMMRLQAVPN